MSIVDRFQANMARAAARLEAQARGETKPRKLELHETYIVCADLSRKIDEERDRLQREWVTMTGHAAAVEIADPLNEPTPEQLALGIAVAETCQLRETTVKKTRKIQQILDRAKRLAK